eukprot:3408769-Alexandrium_andersonii.AAC.1
MPGAVRGHLPREQRPQRGARGPARDRVLGGPGAGERRERGGGGCELLVRRRPSVGAGCPKAAGSGR